MGTKGIFGVKQLLTTFDAADICYVTPNTIKNWIKSGQLKAYCTPGGHYRIRKEDLDRFVQEHQMATKSVGEPKMKPRVLVVGLGEDEETMKALDPENYELLEASTAFDAGIKTVMLDPDVILVDNLANNGLDIEGICRAIRSIDSIKHIPVIALAESEVPRKDRPRFGANEYIVRGSGEDELTNAIDRWAFKMLG